VFKITDTRDLLGRWWAERWPEKAGLMQAS
jgi:hypothetical protein